MGEPRKRSHTRNTHETVTRQRMSADKSKKGKGGQNNSLLAKRSGQSRCGLCYPWPDTDMPTRWQGDKTLAITPPPLEQRRVHTSRRCEEWMANKIKEACKRKQKCRLPEARTR